MPLLKMAKACIGVCYKFVSSIKLVGGCRIVYFPARPLNSTFLLTPIRHCIPVSSVGAQIVPLVAVLVDRLQQKTDVMMLPNCHFEESLSL